MQPNRTLLVCALLSGCTGSSSTPPAGTADVGPTPSWVDSGAPVDGLAAREGGLAAREGGSPDAAAGCANGNLFALVPTVPALCRPFAAAQPGAFVSDPATCKQMPKIDGTAGADRYDGTVDGKDIISGLDGDDIIKGGGCSDWLNGNMGDDQIFGGTGNDELRGGAGNDTIHGGVGQDAIWGGAGNDTLYGDLDDDAYMYSEGSGDDVIMEIGGNDKIVCAENDGTPRARLLGWQRVGDDLVLKMSGSGSITVMQYFVTPDRSIDLIVGCE